MSMANFCHTTPFRIKSNVVTILVLEHVSLSGEGSLLETSEFFAFSHGGFQPLNFLRLEL